MQLETGRLILRTASRGMLSQMLDYLVRNEDFLREWSPERFAPYDATEVSRMIELEQRGLESRSCHRFHISLKGEERIIGSIGLSSVIYGVFLSCFVGYKLDGAEINRGYMTEALVRVSDFAFSELGLHRLEANIMPRNAASIRVATKAGYRCEGWSPQYLKIGGRWEDHAHYVLLNENPHI